MGEYTYSDDFLPNHLRPIFIPNPDSLEESLL